MGCVKTCQMLLKQWLEGKCKVYVCVKQVRKIKSASISWEQKKNIIVKSKVKKGKKNIQNGYSQKLFFTINKIDKLLERLINKNERKQKLQIPRIKKRTLM